jgi:hypothetical protein
MEPGVTEERGQSAGQWGRTERATAAEIHTGKNGTVGSALFLILLVYLLRIAAH